MTRPNKNIIKIAIYSGQIPSTTFIEHLIDALSKQKGIEILLFGRRNSKVSYKGSVKQYGNPSNKFLNLLLLTYWSIAILFYPKRYKVLSKQLKKYENAYEKFQWRSRYLPVLLHMPYIFHVQWAKDLSKWMFLKEEFDCKIILSLLGSQINYSPISDPELAKRYLRDFRKVDAFHAISKAISKEVEQYGADPSKIKVIHTLLRPNILSEFEQKSLQSDSFKIISVGRHHWVKGYRYALHAIKILKDHNINVSYTIIAAGPISEELLFLRAQLGLKDSVHFKQGVPQKDLFTIMKTYDVFLLPSLSEGIANVVLEAMALGIPVISTDCGGMAEVVKHKETGWLVPVRDPKAIADAVVEVSETSESELQRITQNAHDFVKQHFNAEDSIAKFLELYQGVMNDE